MFELSATVKQRGANLELAFPLGETIAVLGPNGSGKSTLIGLVAGLISPDSGHAWLGDRVLFDVAESRWLPTHRRRIALLAQDATLFPHLSVIDNVAFGPRSQGVSRSQSRTQAREHLRALNVEHLADRRPSQLSGGQAQRVALARAMAAEPDVLLLDEPMAALDIDAAPEIRGVLRGVTERLTTIMVTHDVVDAAALADRIVTIEAGEVVESGPTRELLSRPRSDFLARVAGFNVVSGHLSGTTLLADGLRIEANAAPEHTPQSAGVALFRPEDVTITPELSVTSARNVFPVLIEQLDHSFGAIQVRGTVVETDVTLSASVLASSVADLDIRAGRVMFFGVKAHAVTLVSR